MNGLTFTPTSETSDLQEVDLYLTSETLEVYLCDLYLDLQRSTLGGFEFKCHTMFIKIIHIVFLISLEAFILSTDCA